MTDIVDNMGKTILVNRGDDYQNHRGLEGKDAAFLAAHFGALADRNIIDVVRDEGRHGSSTTHTTTKAVELAVEKTAAATNLAIEKIGAAAALQAAQNTAAVQAAIAECCCSTKALILEVEARVVRDDLFQTRAELAALKAANLVCA